MEEAYTLDATATSTARYDLLQLYLNQGQSLSASGDLTDAIVLYRHALELAETLEIEPEIKAYADYSKALSADEKFDEAVTQFELAWDLDPDFTHLNKIDLVRLYQSRGDQLAETGLITEAMQYYEKAHGLAPTLNLHSAVDAYIIYGKALMTSENYYAANTAFSQILELKQNFDITSTLSATEWNQICWHGTLSVVDVQAERASYLAPIIAACERAVALEPDSASIRDSRGVARALTEDVLGAIEDFSFYVEWSKENNPTSKYIASREDWISRLKAKEAPATVFDRETLLSLRDE